MKNDTKTRLEISLNVAAYAKVFARKHKDLDENLIREAMMIGAELALQEVTKKKDVREVKSGNGKVLQFPNKFKDIKARTE